MLRAGDLPYLFGDFTSSTRFSKECRHGVAVEAVEAYNDKAAC